MLQWFTKADRTADILVRWGGLYLVVTSFFSWLNRQLPWFSDLGWAEIIFLAIWMALVAVFLFAASLAAIRYFRPPTKRVAESPPEAVEASAMVRKRLLNAIIDPNRLYVAEISASAGRLEEEHVLEFGFRFFNATEKHLALSQVKGTIECAMVDPYGATDHIELPPPTLLERGANLNDIEPLSETMIVLQQHLPPKLAARLEEALQREGLQFYFDELGILMTGTEDRSVAAAVPIDCGVFLRNDSGIRWGRIIRARMEATL